MTCGTGVALPSLRVSHPCVREQGERIPSVSAEAPLTLNDTVASNPLIGAGVAGADSPIAVWKTPGPSLMSQPMFPGKPVPIPAPPLTQFTNVVIVPNGVRRLFAVEIAVGWRLINVGSPVLNTRSQPLIPLVALLPSRSPVILTVKVPGKTRGPVAFGVM